MIDRVSTYLGGDFDATYVYILPWSIGIRDARLKMKDIPVQINVKRVRIEFDILSFLKNNLQLSFGAKNIFVDEPRFVWHLSDTSSVPDKFSLADIPEFSLINLPFVQINIVKGSLVFARGDSTFIFADNVNGLLDGYKSTVMNLNLEGRVLSETVNTSLNGVIDRQNDSVVLDITSSVCDFSRKKPDILSGNITIDSGLLDYNLHIEKIGSKNRLNGSYSINKGSFSLKNTNFRVSDVVIKGKVNESEVFFDSVTGEIWNVNPELSGRLQLKPEPALFLFLTARDIDLATVLKELYPERGENPYGKLNISSTFEGPLRNLIVKLDVSSDSLWFRNHRFDDVDAEMSVIDGNAAFHHFNVSCRGFELEGHGETSNLLSDSGTVGEERKTKLSITAVNSSDLTKTYELRIDGTVGSDIRHCEAGFDLKINRLFGDISPGNTVRELSGHSASSTLQDKPRIYDLIKGNFSLTDEELKYSFGNTYFSFEGNADDVFNNADISSKIALADFPALEFIGIKDKEFIVNGDGNVTGHIDSLTVAGDFHLLSGENLNSLLSGKADVRNILSKSRTIMVDARLVDHHLRFSHPAEWGISLKANTLSASAVIEDKGGATLVLAADFDKRDISDNIAREHIGHFASSTLSGYLDLDEFPLERIIDIFKKEEFNHRARFTGRAEIGGTIAEPFFFTPQVIRAEELNIGALDRLSGTVKVSGSPGELTFSDVNIERKQSHILHADGRWLSGMPFILEAQGKNVPFGAIGDIISERRKCDGEADYSFTMVFTRKTGTINGNFNIRDGHFLDVPFDRASGVLGGGSEGFLVKDFTVGKEGSYSGNGYASSGYFWKDVTEAPGLRMQLVFEGNLPLVLPHLTGAIKEANGESRLTLEFGGVWQEPVIMSGELDVSKGMVKPSFLFDAVTDINVILSIDPDQETASGHKAVRIRTASGNINDKKLIVSNIHPGDDSWERISEEKRELLTITHSQIGLDYGVLMGRIDRGEQRNATLQLSVPGFMEQKETGTFLVSGQNDRSFLVGAADAGDHLTPYLCGNILVRSGDITYPLLKVPSSGGNTDFLNDIFWDLTLSADS
ncbi:hypothetical protein ACFL1R_11860, partial [Candidatus Latescibacterota bacterium]